MKTSVIIVGGGLGGLFTGAFLAKNGISVTVLEKNETIGGGLQCFYRNGKLFETGMHVMGGFEKGGNLYKMCRYLGILDELNIHHIDHACMDEIRYGKNKEVFRIPSGKEAFKVAMSGYFPEEADGIRQYVDEIYRLAEEVPLFQLRESPDGIMLHSDMFTWSADRLISHYVTNEKLREILAYLSPLYGGVKGHTPAYIHALINVLYINGASRFIDGSQQLAEALKWVITNQEGVVLSGREVTRIEVQERKAAYVQTDKGEIFSADWYISSIHPETMMNITSPGAFTQGFKKRLYDIPVSYSAFPLFIDLKPKKFPYIDHTCYYVEEVGAMWNQDQFDAKNWPKGFMYMTPPTGNQGEYADRLLVHCVMGYDQVQKWENTKVGKRGSDYEKWKTENIERVISKLNTLYPGFSDTINHVYAASPLTIRDYYHTKEGCIFGYRKDCENLIASQISIYTKVDNLLLTGQNISLHGICGVPLTAITTAEAILGKYAILKQLNHE